MKKTAVLLFSLLTFFALQAAVPVIVIPDQAKDVEKTAASELSEMIQASAGEKPVIAKESKAPAGRKIFVGNTKKAKAAGIETASWKPEEWSIRALNADMLIIAGGYPRGTVYGVYEFLERCLGVVWLDEWDTFVPKTKNINWSAKLNLKGKPSFDVRSIYSYWGPSQKMQEIFRTRMRQNMYYYMNYPRLKFNPAKSEAWKRGARIMVGKPRMNHTYFYYTEDLPKEKESILSWSAALKKRVRSVNSNGPGQVCYSNPETAAWFVAKLKKYIALDRQGKIPNEWPVLYKIAKNDNHNECECPGCLALLKKYGSQNGVQLHFSNAIARSIAKEYPQVRIVHDVYGKGNALPKNIVPEPNVLLAIAFGDTANSERPRDVARDFDAPYNRKVRTLIESYAKLGKKGGGTILGDDYWIDYYGKNRFPTDLASTIGKNLKFYYRTGMVQYAFIECEDAANTSFHALRIWLGYRMMNNAEADPEAEISRFMNAYYGKAAPQMTAYRELIKKGQASLSDPLFYYAPEARPDMTPEFFRKAYALFAQAEKVLQNDQVHLDRIRREQTSLDRARIELRNKLKDPSLPSVETALKRYEKEFTRVCKKYERRDTCQSKLAKLSLFITGVRANIPKLKEFNPAAVVADFAWPELVGGNYHNTRIADPQAFGGFALQPLNFKKKNKGIAMGVYSREEQRYMVRGGVIPAQAVPQDEQYHWYSVGNLSLATHCFIYMDPSWVLQKALDKVYGDPEAYNNNVAIYVHLKVQGPAFVKGSTKPVHYLVDRVVVCRADRDWPHPVSTALPAELKDRKIRSELSGTSLSCATKIYDPASAVRCAVKINIPQKIILAQTMNKRSDSLETKNIKADGHYHLYRIGKAKLANHSLLTFGSFKVRLDEYWNSNTKERTYEIFLSLRKDNKFLYLDRIFLAEPAK